MFDRDMRYIAANRRWRSEVASGTRRLIGRSHYEVFPSLPERWKWMHRRGLAGERLRSDHDLFAHPSGTVLSVEWTLDPWLEADGSVGGIIITTAALSPEQAALAQRDLLQREVDALFEQQVAGIAVIAWDGRVIRSNGRYGEILHRKTSELDGRAFDEFMHEHDCSDMREQFARLREDACQRMQGMHRQRRPDGSVVWLDHAISRLDARDAASSAVVMFVTDATARMDLRQRLRETDRIASLGMLGASVGHDMNNVLLPVRAHVNVIGASRGRMRAGQLEMHLSQVRAGLSYLQNLADSLHGLALDPESEVDGGGLTDLCAWWKKSQPILEKTLHRRAQLDSFVDESTPEVGAPAHALTRALLNLLVNAAEAMPEGRPQSACRVLVRIRSAEGAAVIEVTDNGSGMTDEVRRRAFDVFYTTKTRGLGTGLGLPLVRRVVERAGGSVEVESRVGLGTTVRLRLPAVDRELATVHPTAHVRLEDGRCAAIIRGYLDMFGVAVDAVQSVEDADMLVADADYTSVDDARRWCASRDPGMLVLVGEPLGGELAELRNLGVTVIRDGTDIRAIEQGLVGALRLKEETKNERE